MQPVEDGVFRAGARLWADRERGRKRRGDSRRIANRCEFDERYAGVEFVEGEPTDLGRQARFSHPAGTGQRREAMRPYVGEAALNFGNAPDERVAPVGKARTLTLRSRFKGDRRSGSVPHGCRKLVGTK